VRRRKGAGSGACCFRISLMAEFSISRTRLRCRSIGVVPNFRDDKQRRLFGGGTFRCGRFLIMSCNACDEEQWLRQHMHNHVHMRMRENKRGAPTLSSSSNTTLDFLCQSSSSLNDGCERMRSTCSASLMANDVLQPGPWDCLEAAAPP
jgi:hypothetical protein